MYKIHLHFEAIKRMMFYYGKFVIWCMASLAIADFERTLTYLWLANRLWVKWRLIAVSAPYHLLTTINNKAFFEPCMGTYISILHLHMNRGSIALVPKRDQLSYNELLCPVWDRSNAKVSIIYWATKNEKTKKKQKKHLHRAGMARFKPNKLCEWLCLLRSGPKNRWSSSHKIAVREAWFKRLEKWAI